MCSSDLAELRRQRQFAHDATRNGSADFSDIALAEPQCAIGRDCDASDTRVNARNSVFLKKSALDPHKAVARAVSNPEIFIDAKRDMLRSAVALQPMLVQRGIVAWGQRIGFEHPNTGRDRVRDPEITVGAGSDSGDSNVFWRTQTFAINAPGRRDPADLVGSLRKENIAVATAQDLILRPCSGGAVDHYLNAEYGCGV